MPYISIGEQLKKNKRWHFIPGKNKILPVIESALKSDELVVDLIDGFYPDTDGSSGGAGDSGVILVTDRNVMMLRSESPGRYDLLKRDKISGIALMKNFSSLTLKIESGKSEFIFVTHMSEASVKDIFNSDGKTVQKTGADSGVPVDGDRLYEAGSSKIADNQRVMSRLLFAEIKKIRDKLSDMSKALPDKSFNEHYKGDICTLTSLCGVNNHKLADNELLFIYMAVTAAEENSTGDFSLIDEVAVHDSFPLYLRDRLNCDMNCIMDTVGRCSESGVGELKLLKTLANYDNEHETAYADKLAALYYEYTQCLLKADGVIDGTEEEKLKRISGVIQESKKSEPPTISDTASEEESIDQVMKKINELVGMENIKEEIKSFINYVSIRKERERRSLPITPLSLHAVFYGPPGTGKTTIARLLGKVYRALGLLKSGHLVETDRAGLVAGYVGQTAIKTDEMVNSAKDGVLFIDEAYTLVPVNSSNDFGSESVDTILKRMEDMREGFAVIAAGYTDEMERFINSNPGLKSRFSRYFYFNHYTPEELMQIFSIFAENVEFRLSDDATEKLTGLITYFYDQRGRSFGNARFVRNVFDRIVQNQANRLASVTPLTDELLCEVTSDDIPVKEDFTTEQFS